MNIILYTLKPKISDVFKFACRLSKFSLTTVSPDEHISPDALVLISTEEIVSADCLMACEPGEHRERPLPIISIVDPKKWLPSLLLTPVISAEDASANRIISLCKLIARFGQKLRPEFYDFQSVLKQLFAR